LQTKLHEQNIQLGKLSDQISDSSINSSLAEQKKNDESMIIKLTNQITILETEKELLSVSLSEQKDRLIKQSAETSELQNKLNDQTIQFNRLSEKKDSDEQIISSIALQKAKDDESMIIRLNNQIAVLQREKELTSSDQAGQNHKLALSSAENSALKEQIGSLDLKNKKISEENSLLIRQSVEMTENIKKKEQINLSEIKIEKKIRKEKKKKKRLIRILSIFSN